MVLSKTINSIAIEADNAYDNKNSDQLKNIAEDCLNKINSNDYSELEKGFLSYIGATAFNNYIGLIHCGKMRYSEDVNNEADFEFAIYLFRRSLEALYQFRNDREKWKATNTKLKNLYVNYLNSTYTNFANMLYQSGRIQNSISLLKIGLENDFIMAIGNMASKLIVYADLDYDKGHSKIYYKEAYQLLLKALQGNDLHKSAREFFEYQKNALENNFSVDNLLEPYNFKNFSLGTTTEENKYREWSLNHHLFLNTLNDYFSNPIVAHDCIHLPDIITDINTGPKYHGFFNQLKQEYVSARHMIYEGFNKLGDHYSDKDVYLYNTLDYPLYGLNIEQIKCAYRSLYSLFDKIAFFINEYFDIGIKHKDVTFTTIWDGEKPGKKNGYKYNINLKVHMTLEDCFNPPLIGLYWLFKDIGKTKVKHDYLEPSIKNISEIRHALEHRYFKVHDNIYCENETDLFKDELSYSVYIEDFRSYSMDLLKLSREAIMLLVLAITREEQIRKSYRKPNSKIAPIFLDKYEDEWKQLFF